MRHLVWALLPLSRQIFVQNSNLETSERAEMPYYQRSLPNHQIFMGVVIVFIVQNCIPQALDFCWYLIEGRCFI